MEASRAKLVERFVELMERISAQRRARPPQEWTELEFTLPQLKTLFFLSQEPKRMRALATYLGRGMSAATSMIDRLVKKGLVARLEDLSDRRVVACRLTPLGEEVVERSWRRGRDRNEAIARVLTLDELQMVVPAMEVLSAAVGRQNDAREGDYDEADAEAMRLTSV